MFCDFFRLQKHLVRSLNITNSPKIFYIMSSYQVFTVTQSSGNSTPEELVARNSDMIDASFSHLCYKI